MTRDQAEAVVSALTKYLNAAAAAQYSNDSALRASQAVDAYEHLIEKLMGIN